MHKKKAGVICFSILLLASMISVVKAANLSGSGPTMYAAFEGYMTYERTSLVAPQVSQHITQAVGQQHSERSDFRLHLPILFAHQVLVARLPSITG